MNIEGDRRIERAGKTKWEVVYKHDCVVDGVKIPFADIRKVVEGDDLHSATVKAENQPECPICVHCFNPYYIKNIRKLKSK